ncbi:MAG: hypothetical protein Q8M69_20695, partial [Reyranella sp.]|nr:hypothetical protein [Reyranella sp.]
MPAPGKWLRADPPRGPPTIGNPNSHVGNNAAQPTLGAMENPLENPLSWLDRVATWAPNWVISLAFLLLAAGVAVTLHGLAMRLL